MHCGAPLPDERDRPAVTLDDDIPDPEAPFVEDAPSRRSGLAVFLFTALGTLLLSALLILVFDLPIFIFGAVLPLVWLGASRRR